MPNALSDEETARAVRSEAEIVVADAFDKLARQLRMLTVIDTETLLEAVEQVRDDILHGESL